MTASLGVMDVGAIGEAQRCRCGKPASWERSAPDGAAATQSQTHFMPSSSFRVLIAGGGVAALEAVLALQDLDLDRALDVEIIAPDSRFVYRPLAVRDPFGARATREYDLELLVERAGAKLRRGQVDVVEPDERLVTLKDGTQLDYDALLLATGAAREPALRGMST